MDGGPSPRTEIVHNIFGDEPGALRVGDYKLVVGDPLDGYAGARPYNGYNGWGGAAPNSSMAPCAAAPCVFHIPSDPAERHDLAKVRPVLAARLHARYAELRRTEVSLAESGLCPSGLIPARGERDGCTANRAGAVWGPWLSRP